MISGLDFDAMRERFRKRLRARKVEPPWAPSIRDGEAVSRALKLCVLSIDAADREIEAGKGDRDYLYRIRNAWVMDAIGLACHLGLRSGVAIDVLEPEWPVYYVELPTGQVSWHLPRHQAPWDGHDAEQKTDRIRRFVNGETTP